MADDMRTQMLSPDLNRTILGTAPTLNATVTIKPTQCPVCKTFNPAAVMFCVDCGLIFDRALDGDAFGAPAVRLPVLVDPNGKEHVLRPGVNVIGRAGDISIEDARISRRHAQVTMDEAGITVEDLGSTNGSKIDDAALAAGQKAALTSGQSLSLGGFKLVLSFPGDAAKTQMGLSGRTAAISAAPTISNAVAFWVAGTERFPIVKGKNSFGRKSDNMICLPDPYVSGYHGEIEATDDGLFLTDLGSTNGTLLNGTKMVAEQRVRLTPDDVVKLGERELRLES